MDATLLQFICHASVLLRYGDRWVLTDPWYHRAFSSWYPCPPPCVSADWLVSLARTGKLALVLSHLHPDHVDAELLSQMPKSCPVFIPRFRTAHLRHFLDGIGFSAVAEIDDNRSTFGDFLFDCFPHHDSPFDAAVSIETPDAFIFHGNDSWTLSAIAMEKLKRVRPGNKAALFMGQGGSASGYPLTYFQYPPAEREQTLRRKNENMLRSLARTAQDAGFSRALAYACFTEIVVEGKEYSHKAPVLHGRYANQVTGADLFLDLSPGDLYLPAEDRVIPMYGSLHWDPRVFVGPREARSFPAVSENAWENEYRGRLEHFLGAFRDFSYGWRTAAAVDGAAMDIEFTLEAVAPGWKRACAVSLSPAGVLRKKQCRASPQVLAAFLDRRIPFEDLYTGYLAEWSRDPDSVHNRAFLLCLLEFGYRYLEAGEKPCSEGKS